MPIPLPTLDDRTFDDLTAEARDLIGVLRPDWTDHSPSDPGIVLVELLAWITEMLIYQVDQIPPTHTHKFLKLLGGPDWSPPPGGDLDAAVRATMRELNEQYRAVTCADYEHLVRDIWPGSPEAAELGETARIRRVRCVSGVDLTADDPETPAPAHVNVIVVPEPGSPHQGYPRPTDELTAALTRFLAPRRMLTTRQHVLGPRYVDVGLTARLALRDDSPPADALSATLDRLAAFFDPLTGGDSGDGWPFGRSVHVSEVYAVLDQVRLVDYVDGLRLHGPTPGDGEPTGVELGAHELVRLSRVELTGYDSYGRTHPLVWTVPS